MVHALGPTYLSLLLADKMRESRKMTGVKSRICIVGSDTHWFANREGWAKKETGVLEDLRREGAAKPDKWYVLISNFPIDLLLFMSANTWRELNPYIGTLFPNS